MERASKLIRGLRSPSGMNNAVISAEELACAAWPGAVGKTLAAHTRAARMVRSRLVVEVEDAPGQRQLFGLSRHILANLGKSLGRGLVRDGEFRVAPRRREPRRATPSTPARFTAA